MTEQTPPVTVDEERQALAREYARISRRLMLLELVLAGGYFLLWLITDWHTALRSWITGFSNAPVLTALLYVVLFGAPYMLIDQPLSYYGGFVLPHRYKQSVQTFSHWVTDQLKGLILSGLFGVILITIFYILLRAAPESWWIYGAGVAVLFNVIMAVLNPVLIVPLFYKFTPLEDDELAIRLMTLAGKAGIGIRGVYRIDMSTRTRSANAAVMGLGATRRIVLGDTLLEDFTADEIETIMAHEIGHLVHKDVPLLVATNAVLTTLSFWVAHLALSWSAGWLGLESLADPAGLPVFGLVIGLVGLVAMPLSNAFSRWRESKADQYSFHITRKPEAFVSAMTRLANQNLGEIDPERWVVLLLYSHPPIGARIAAAKAAITEPEPFE